MSMYGLRGELGKLKRVIGIVEEDEIAKENNGEIVWKSRRQLDREV